MTAQPYPSNPFEALEPEALEKGIHTLVACYQNTRSGPVAWFVVRYAQALCRHPDFEGGDEERCAWRRLASQWRRLARVPAHQAALAEGGVA